MKKNIKLLIFIFIFSFYILDVNANSYTATVTDKDGVYIRTGPGTNYSYKTLISYKKTIQLVSNKLYNTGDSNCSKGWVEAYYNGKSGYYVCSNCIKITETEEATGGINSDYKISSDGNYYTTKSWSTRINENYATVRTSASINASSIEVIYLGTDVKILSGPTNKSSSCTTGWYKISYYNNKTGYVCARLVDDYSKITKTDTEYAKKLKAEGFPDSYIPYLSYLHSLHPNWNFKAEKSTKKFNTVVDKETGKNYTQSTYAVYRLNNTLKENPNWYTASSAMTAFYIDPRNYLNEKNIFAFLLQSYDKKNHTRSVLETLFSGTYLANGDEDYIKYFLEAAETYKISPVLLAARVKQEGGTNENYDGVSGKSNLTYNGKSLKGYYNYYNIGAYQDSVTKSAVTRGLAVAAGIVDNYDGTPWNTREKAIKYGAQFITKRYVGGGQDTLYYQKFNTKDSASSTAYTNQYMTNIIAPASESLSIYYAYQNANLLDVGWTFSIPVYTNTPDEYTSHPPVGNTNNDLSSLKINNTLVNGFDSDVLTYDYYVTDDTKEVVITATAKSNKSTIKGTGTIKLEKDETTVNITVTSEVGTTKTYNVTIIKKKTTDKDIKVSEIINNMDFKLSNGYLTNIAVLTTAGDIKNTINKSYPSAKVTITDNKNNSKEDNLATGDIITIVSGTDKQSYTIVIKGDINGDGKINSIDLLRVQKHILKYSTLKNEYKDAADVSYDDKINSLDLLRVQKHILGYIKIK